MNTVSSVGMIGALLLSGAAQALDWSQDWSDWEVRPHIATGIMQYKYEQQARTNLVLRDAEAVGDLESVGAGFGGIEAEDSLLFAEIGVSAFFGNFFVDLSFQKSDEGGDDFTVTGFSGAEINGETAFLGIGLDTQREMDREELSLSIGYAFSDRMGVFAGYKRNNTQFDDRIRTGQFILAADSQAIATDITGSASSEFEQDGFFLGATYVWPFESDGWLNGALAVDVGVAFLDGDLSIKDQATLTSEDLDISESAATNTDASGEAVGINLGIAWSAPLTDRLSYSLGVDGYNYDYDGDGDSADFTDTVLRFSLGVSYAIDSKGVF